MYDRSKIKCDRCLGRGWLPPVIGDWCTPCGLCEGKGSVSLHALSSLIDEDPSYLYRLADLRVRPLTARRLFFKLTQFLEEFKDGRS